jgi:hypothetical protein
MVTIVTKAKSATIWTVLSMESQQTGVVLHSGGRSPNHVPRWSNGWCNTYNYHVIQREQFYNSEKINFLNSEV